MKIIYEGFMNGGSIKTICFVVFVMTMVFLVHQTQGVDWVPIDIGGSTDSMFLYDRETITKLPNNIIKVWIKRVFSDKEKKTLFNS